MDLADRGVAVVGNGPVGQTTALLLARWGVPVVLLDARPCRDLVGSKAICQQRDVLDVWESVGVGRRIADEGVTWTTARTYYRNEELFSYKLGDPGRSAFPPFVNISQARTEELLDERIAREPLIDVRWKHEVTGLTQDDSGVTLECTGGRSVRTAYAVACAGARGDVLRRALGVRFEGHSFEDRFLICDIRADLPGWAHERRFHFDPSWNPGRQVLIHPCPDSTFRIDWQVPGDYDIEAEESDGRLAGRIRAIIGETPYEIVWKSVYRFQSRVVDRMRAGRVLIAGDCAHLVSPFGARGLNSGVGDAENAAWKLAWVLHGRAGEELLESYHAERHAAAVENIEVTTATMDFLVPQNDEQHATRVGVLSKAAGDPAMQARVDSGRLSEPFWYVRSPLVTLDPSRPFVGRPPRGGVPAAGPGILAPDVPVTPVPSAATARMCTRFRELARDGFLVLGCGIGAEAALPVSDAGAGQPGSGAEADLSVSGAGAGPPGSGAGAALPVSGAGAGLPVSGAEADLPVRTLRLEDIDPGGVLTAALGARAGERWLIRPDAYVAAVASTEAELAHAYKRALGAAARTPA